MEIQNDRVFLESALEDLARYILSKEVYWPLHPSSHLPDGFQIPQLTIGNLLLAQVRLSAEARSEQDKAELSAAALKINNLRDEWKTNWGLKAGKEFTTRLYLWKNYLDDLLADRRGEFGEYPRQVRQRVILQLLASEVIQGIPLGQVDEIQRFDHLLRGLTQPGPFIWEPRLAASFSASDFWFLYVQFGKER